MAGPSGSSTISRRYGSSAGPRLSPRSCSSGPLVRFECVGTRIPIRRGPPHSRTGWIRRPPLLSAEAGMHRFVWDLHYAPPASLSHEYPISATYRDTPLEPRGPWVLPGSYVVQLTVSGKAYTQPLTVRMDPHVRTPVAGLALP